MKITLKKACDERDFQAALTIESQVCAQSGAERFPQHIGGLIFDRFLFGGGGPDFFQFGYLLYADGALIGYAQCYADEGDFDFTVLPAFRTYLPQILPLLEAQLPGDITTTADSRDKALLAALKDYADAGECRWQGVLDLQSADLPEPIWSQERLRALEEGDLANRARYGDIPTHAPLEERLYRELMATPYYALALDRVIEDRHSGQFIGYVSWWLDADSKTALLEPVACLPAFRRRGIMKRALLSGLRELKQRGIRFVYVSTSAGNAAAQALYQSAGFRKVGEAREYRKQRLQAPNGAALS